MVEQLDADRVLEALAQLPEIYRAAVALFYLDELSYKEIAGITGIAMGTVMSRLARARERLQEHLAKRMQKDP